MSFSFSKVIALIGLVSSLLFTQYTFAMKSAVDREVIRYPGNKYLILEQEGLWYRSIIFPGIGKVQFFADEAEKVVQLLQDGSKPPEVKDCGFLSGCCRLKFSSAMITVASADVPKVLKIFESDLLIDLTYKKILDASGVSVSFYPAFVRAKELDSMNPNFNFNMTIDHIKIKTHQGEKVLNLPPEFQTRLTQFLSLGVKKACRVRQETPADCFLFCVYMNNAYAQYSYDNLLKRDIVKDHSLNFTEVKPEDLQIGDSILMDKPGQQQFHYAFYLGDGLFVSKFGGLGIFFTNLEAMLDCYGRGDRQGYKFFKIITTGKSIKTRPYAPDYN